MSPTTRNPTGRLSGATSTSMPALRSTFARFRQGRAASMMLDFVICALALVLAYVVRFEGRIPSFFYGQLMILAPILVVTRALAGYGFGIYRMVWRYVGLHEAVKMAWAIATVSALLLVGRLVLAPYMPHVSIPLSIIVMEGMLTFLAMTGVRFIPRILRERVRPDAGAPTLLIGAGQGGLAIVKEAARHPELGIRPVGFLDDDPSKTGMEIANLRVFGTIQEIAQIIERNNVERVILTSSAFGPKTISRVIDACSPLGVDVRIVQGTYENLGDSEEPATARSVREVRIEDLLSRDPVPPSLSLTDLVRSYGGKRILVTGAGGSIGSELCRQLAHMQPAALILAERDETNLFEIERELVAARVGPSPVPLLLDLMDAKAVERAFKDHAPDVIFHAAAYKHVPMMERFPWESVRNNVLATKQLVELAEEHGVEAFVMISTDKAINPSSVMGATKRFAEQIVQDLAVRSRTRFSCVRFGNVLGSRGSVVGIFKDQIAAGGPVTVTHPEATRYFMTIPEAANLVLQAGTLGARGEVFLLDMGEPVKIMELARQLIRLSGYTEEQIGIRVVGTRPGEKLFEELSTTNEDLSPTELRKIFRCKPIPVQSERLTSILDRLQFMVRARDADGIRSILSELDIGYQRALATQATDA